MDTCKQTPCQGPWGHRGALCPPGDAPLTVAPVRVADAPVCQDLGEGLALCAASSDLPFSCGHSASLPGHTLGSRHCTVTSCHVTGRVLAWGSALPSPRAPG